MNSRLEVPTFVVSRDFPQFLFAVLASNLKMFPDRFFPYRFHFIISLSRHSVRQNNMASTKRDSSVGIATGYGLDDQGRREFESR
jgi:hypothetical protein